MPQGKFFHIFWSIFTTQISAYHFHISERWNESILFLKGSSPPLPCHFLWAAELLWVMDGCEMFLCNADKESLYCSMPQSEQTLQPALWVNSYQVSWFIETNKRRRRKMYLDTYVKIVFLWWRVQRLQSMLKHKARTLVVLQEHSCEVNLERFILLFCLLVLKSEDQTLFSINGKHTSGRPLSQILGLRL